MKTEEMKKIDAQIGAAIREMRITKGLSMECVADAIGVTYQQFHKYEKGLNRVCVARLIAISNALGVVPQYFVDKLGEAPKAAASDKMCLAAARNFAAIKSPKLRKAVNAMLLSLAAEDGE